MPNRSHSKVHDRTYFGQDEAKVLVDWLSSDATDNLKLAVVNFLKVNDETPAHPTRSQLAHAQKAYDQMYNLVELGGQYVERKVVAEADDRGNVRWVEREFPIGPIAKHKVPFAVYSDVMELEKLGLLDRVRKCERPGCGKWFFARFAHARFDSVACQRETLRADPKWRKKRARYMQKLRRLHKTHPNLKGGK